MVANDPRTKDLFLAAMELTLAEQGPFLDRACAGDGKLRASVEALLCAEREAGAFLTAGNDERLGPGDLVAGRFAIREMVGEGGFGIVYRAEQREPIERMVALKVLKPGVGGERVVRRFALEQKALARMEHASIATVLDAGQTEAGAPFFVMEFVDGMRIDRWCRERDPDLATRLRLFEQVCRAIQHAHQKGVLHRDLKPSNVLVVDGDGEQEPVCKVIDFGMAKRFDVAAPADATLQHEIIGTPGYMSPEQAAGTDDVDTRTDVYALGSLFYDLLCGSAPFQLKSATPVGYGDLLRRVCDDMPERPSQRLLRGASVSAHYTAVELRAELDWIVMRCLAKSPDERYDTAAAVADELRRVHEGVPVLARPPSWRYQFGKFARRHWLPLVTVAAFVLLAVGAIVAVTNWAIRATRAEEEARREVDKYEHIATFTMDLLGSIDPAVAQEADTVLLRGMLDRAVVRLRESPATDPAVDAALHNTLGYAYLRIGVLDRAVAFFERALSASRNAHEPGAMTTLRIQRNLVVALSDASRYREACELADELWQTCRRVLGDDAEMTVEVEGLVGVTADRIGDQQRAADVLAAVLERQRAALGDEHDQVLTTSNNYANLLSRLGQHDEALALHESVLRAQRSKKPETHPHVLKTLNNLAETYGNLGRHEDAVRVLRDVLAKKRRVFDDGHPSIIAGLSNLARALADLGEPDEAEQLYEQCCQLAEQHLGIEHGHYVATALNHALFLRGQERFEQARRVYETLMPPLRRTRPAEHPIVINAVAAYGATLVDVGDGQRAVEVIEELLPTVRAKQGADMEVAMLLRVRGKAWLSLGRLPDAGRDLQASWAIVSGRPASDRQRVSTAELLAEWRARSGDGAASGKKSSR